MMISCDHNCFTFYNKLPPQVAYFLEIYYNMNIRTVTSVALMTLQFQTLTATLVLLGMGSWTVEPCGFQWHDIYRVMKIHQQI